MLAAMLCKFNIHHQWHGEHTDDGDLYKRCLRCGKDAYGGDGASDGWALKRWW
ncbi:hypothetical protein ACJJV6_03355 [Arthrobacter nitrophenolicus]|uniref:hypothetical protein n=1 Tax=Arthrobacter nitrophenolicus TaxID=683150 RepID=UPI003899E0FD